ncbi:glyoxylase-like metal-dependent hydrolase (beta-lactamase superfamily II) [Tenacibaculum gallaicum]|uniref:Glyoxylase-like metal-dependent hydrolase (Beta-lactamase superfamily II) n=1 Tax=Tenacibaculum gallaicum TaxID=561505 RepID=A0A0H3YSU1_9FLAO|nr:N-acyl homoserine lactonase family protein [Tenacibaculum gallaicum]AKN24546.1 N-acyl homoserine lactonase [Tenacibaculum gallaicum]REH56602.1 glyoxylase-like metal-dependent hydrolase (beta-lactamase superfamily II) [Tenacibaculum gallaicum]
MKKIFLLALISIITISCKNAEKKQTTEEKTIEKPQVKLHVLDGGSILVNKLEVFSQDTTYTGQSKKLSDGFYVISHPKGNLMWDAGLPEALIVNEPFTEPTGTFTLQRKDSLKNQLKSLGLTIDDFKYISLSHPHFDHTGHANYFKNSTWLIQENEYNFITSDSAKVKDPDTYNSIKELKNVEKINGDHDVFGDGTVVIKYMPGHTIGHQALYVEAGLEKPILLTGDLYHFEENRETKGIPSFNYDVEQTLESMKKFEAFAKEKNAEVIIQHSPKDFKKLQNLLKK